jgi:hypothetical protein
MEELKGKYTEDAALLRDASRSFYHRFADPASKRFAAAFPEVAPIGTDQLNDPSALQAKLKPILAGLLHQARGHSHLIVPEVPMDGLDAEQKQLVNQITAELFKELLTTDFHDLDIQLIFALQSEEHNSHSTYFNVFREDDLALLPVKALVRMDQECKIILPTHQLIRAS